MTVRSQDAQRAMIAKFNRKRQRAQYEAYKRSQQLERVEYYLQFEDKKRRRKQPKNHAVEIELTKRQSEELLYVAFKPTKKDLFLKRY